MTQNDQQTGEKRIISTESAIRMLVLASFYACAVFVAVAFSPSIGFSPKHQAPMIASGHSAALR